MLSRGMEAGGSTLCALPLPHSSLTVSLRREVIPFPGTLIFEAAAGDTSTLPGSGDQRGLCLRVS